MKEKLSEFLESGIGIVVTLGFIAMIFAGIAV